MTVRRPVRPTRSVLLMLAALMAGSGAIRLGLGVQEARALVPQAGTEPKAEAPAVCPEPPPRLIEALRQREERAAIREAAIDDRLAALALVDAAVEARLQELRLAEESLAETLARADGASEQDLGRLTAVYEAMKPKDAAALFETMAPEFAAGFLGRMRPDAAAAVLSGMAPETAYTISVLLAGRNALVPKD